MVDKAYCSIIKKFRLILHIDNGNAYKNWETAQRRICHYDLYTELYVWISSWWSEYYIILMQHQTFLIKTQVGFIVAGDINFPYKHWFATLSVFVLLTVKCSLTTHKNSLLFLHCSNWMSTDQNVTVQVCLVSLRTILILCFYVIYLVLGAFAKLRKADC